MIPILLSGGSGTRLWPVSRATHPKQFCDLFGESLQTLSLRRVSKFGAPWIVTSEALRVLTEKELKDEKRSDVRVVYEPTARNTAAAIAAVCRLLELENRPREIVAIFPSDHLIRDEKAFARAVETAAAQARDGKVVTLGLRPDRPETGYGYIQIRAAGVATDGAHASPVEKFHEKPDRERAEEFLRAGSFLWNAGIFVFRADVMASLLAKHAPDVWNPFAALTDAPSSLKDVYARVKSISIDYAVMEKIGGTGGLVCVPVEMGWNDVGSWDAVADEVLSGTASSSRAIVNSADSRGVYVHAPAGKRVALLGVEDLRVVDTGDALLIAKKGESQNVRGLVEQWAKGGDKIASEHEFENRPWGRFEILRDTERFKSKVIVVDPRQQISYQSHAKREEHWILTRGAGEVVLDDRVIPVRAGSHVHIPIGAKHRIRNTGDEPLEFVEVQLGTYFGEDDIVRYQDDYRRE